MGDGRVRVPLQVHPASHGIASTSDDKPAAVRVKTGDEVVGYRRDGAGINRRKREPGCSSGVTDRDPASMMSCLSPAPICAGSKY
jgi:hypothetical protein